MDGTLEELAEHVLPGEGGRVLPLNSNPGALANAVVVKSGQGICYGFTVYNSNAAQQWILLFSGASAPANGTVPMLAFPVQGKSNKGVDFGVHGRVFRQGLVLCNSSTDTTLTLGAADCLLDVQYI